MIYQCSEMSSEMNGSQILGKNWNDSSSKRYDLLFSKLGDNESELNKVKADVSVISKNVKKIGDFKGFNEASVSKKQFDLINEHLGRLFLIQLGRM